jgi:hypothetical protein
MKKSKAPIKEWSREYNSSFTYYLIVYSNGDIHFYYDTPRESGIPVAKMKADEFLKGGIDHKVKQYLGEDQFLQIKSFLMKKFNGI